jgi:SAM-dependent methyltransferase
VTCRQQILDLACGDGMLLELLAEQGHWRLAGLDLSDGELAAARRRPALSGALLVQGRAQALPFADESFDACVSHMAFMLMSDVEEVAAEIARVLMPGGVLALVLGAHLVAQDAYDLFLRLARPFLRAASDGQRVPPLGDPRTRRAEGLDEILTGAGFAPVEWNDTAVDVTGPDDQVWNFLLSMYDVRVLSQHTSDQLRDQFFAEVESLRLADGRLPCVMGVRLVTTHLLTGQGN